MKKLLLILIVASLVLFIVVLASAADSATVNGYVSDSMCGAKGAKDGHTDCMNKCLSKGATYVIVTDADKKVLTVDNPDAAFQRAVAAGAKVVYPVSDQHGWRIGRVVDPFGHHWEIGRPL